MDQDWQSNIFRVEERTAKLLEKEILTDVSFTFAEEVADENPKVLRAHKLILANASPVFHAMFYGPMAHKTDAALQVGEIGSTTFSAMLKYIYSNDLSFKSWSDAAELYGAAKMYLLNALLKYCVDYMVKALNARNALKVFEFANFHEEVTLIKAALERIRKETLCVIKSPDFLEIPVSTMIKILDQDTLQAKELELFDALEKLAKVQKVQFVKSNHTNALACPLKCETNQNDANLDQFRTAVKKVNFLAMTAQQFASGPANSNLLLPEESLAILCCLVSPNQNTQTYPKEFRQGLRKDYLRRF